MTELVVSVHGVTPGPQGSKRHVGGGRMIEQSKRVKPWRAAVVEAARNAITAVGDDWEPLDGELEMVAVFYLRPPRTLPKGRTGPTVPPDSSKLLRSTEDALTDAGVIVDDSRFTRHVIEKRYATHDRPVGVWLRVRHRHQDTA